MSKLQVLTFCFLLGLNCSEKAICYNVNNCTSHGVCIDIDKCKCDLGWNGTACEELSCEKLGYCSGLCCILLQYLLLLLIL